MSLGLTNLGLGNQNNSRKALWKYMPLVGNNIQVKQDADNIFVKSKVEDIARPVSPYGAATYNAFQYQFQKFALKPLGFCNNRLLKTTSSIGDVSASGSRAVVGGTDENPPIALNNQYVGGNHGWNVHQVTSAGGHGLAAVDIGTRFTNSGRNFYLLGLDTTNPTTIAYFIGENLGTPDRPSFWSTTLAGTLVQQDSTQHDNVTVTITTGTGTKQIGLQTLWNSSDTASPSTTNITCRNIVTSLFANGVTPIGIETVTCSYVVIKQTYDIINIVSELNYIIAHKETFTANPTLDSSAPAFSEEMYLILGDYGTCISYIRLMSYIDCDMSSNAWYGGLNTNTPLVDSIILGGTGAKIKAYFPNIKDSGLGWDNRIQDYVAAAKHITVDNLVDATTPFDRAVWLGYSDDGDGNLPKYGYAVGYVPDVLASYVDRIVNTNEYMETTTIKAYFKSYDDAIADQNNRRLFETLGYRSLFKSQAFGSGNIYWLNIKNYCLVFIDYHAEVTDEAVTLPAIFAGKSYTVLEQSANMTGCSGTLPALAITTSDANHAYAIFKVT